MHGSRVTFRRVTIVSFTTALSSIHISKYLKLGWFRFNPKIVTANINFFSTLKVMFVGVGVKSTFSLDDHTTSVLFIVERAFPANRMVKIVKIRIETIPPETVLY